MTEAPTPTENSKKQRDNPKTPPKTFDYSHVNDYGPTQDAQLELQQPPNLCG